MSITDKIDMVLNEIMKPAKTVDDILRKVKGWKFQYYKNRASELYFVMGKPNKDYEYMVKIEIPNFDDLYDDGKQVIANVSHYDGDKLVVNQQDIIYNWKGLETVLKRNKSIAEKMYKKGMKESISEGMTGYPKVKGWEIEADKYEVDYFKEIGDDDVLHLVFNDMDFPTDASAVITYGGGGSKKGKSTSFDVKSARDIPNTLKKVEKWAKV